MPCKLTSICPKQGTPTIGHPTESAKLLEFLIRNSQSPRIERKTPFVQFPFLAEGYFLKDLAGKVKRKGSLC